MQKVGKMLIIVGGLILIGCLICIWTCDNWDILVLQNLIYIGGAVELAGAILENREKVKEMRKSRYYWIGFIVCMFLSVRHLNSSGIHAKSVLGVLMIQAGYQVIVQIISVAREKYKGR